MRVGCSTRGRQAKLSLAMTVNIDDDVVDVISCVALFYENGKNGNSFLRKEKFRVQLPRKEKRLKSVRETVRQVHAALGKLGSKRVYVSISVKHNCTRFYGISR